MRHTRSRWIVLAGALALTVAACGSDRKASSEATSAPTAAPQTTAAAGGSETTAGSGGSETTAAPGGAGSSVVETAPDQGRPDQFGNLDWPCSAGDGNNADDGSVKGVTKDSVTIATGDDAGYATSPGLNHEMTDAVKAFAKKCNDLGGINGRQIKVNYYDAGIVNVAAAIQGACDGSNFFLVGEGWSLDSGQEEIRQGCGLPAVPGYSVSAAFAMAPDVYQGLPNPADEMNAGIFALVAKLQPDAVTNVATVGGNYSATQETIEKARAVAPEFGWHFIEERFEYDIFGGVTDWTPMVKQIKDAGATAVYWQGSCLPNFQKLAQTMKQNELNVPLVIETNHYADSCRAANTDGAMDNTYMKMHYIPFEEAADNKATQDFIDIVKDNGGDIAQLGMQSASSFLFWATAAQQCGATLTRECVIENMSKVHSWTGGGLHAEADPGGNHTTKCLLLMKFDGTSYTRVTPTEPGTYACDDSWAPAVKGVAAVDALNLGPDRRSHQFG